MKEVEDLYEPDGLAIEGDAAAEMCPEDHVLNQRKKRQFVQLVYECLGIPPEFHHDGSFCWAGPKGTVASVGSLLPFDIDNRVVTSVMRRTWACQTTATKIGTATNPILIDPRPRRSLQRLNILTVLFLPNRHCVLL
jgi:hypothetical protein